VREVPQFRADFHSRSTALANYVRINRNTPSRHPDLRVPGDVRDEYGAVIGAADEVAVVQLAHQPVRLAEKRGYLQ